MLRKRTASRRVYHRIQGKRLSVTGGMRRSGKREGSGQAILRLLQQRLRFPNSDGKRGKGGCH